MTELRTEDFATTAWEGNLKLYADDGEGPKPWLVMGDLRGAFLPDDEPEWPDGRSNHDVGTWLTGLLPAELSTKVEIDPEAATFFAYFQSREDADAFLNWVRELFDTDQKVA